MKCQVDAIQWGGVVAEIFRGLRKPTPFSGGGGSSRIFPWSPKADAIQWGGGSSSIFPWVSKSPTPRDSVGGGSPTNSPLMGPFYIFSLSQRGPPP